MPMVSRVRDALRRLIDDYGSSDDEKGKAPAPVRPKKSGKRKGERQDKIIHRGGKGVDRQSSFSTTGSSEDDPNSVGKEHVEEHPSFLAGMLGVSDPSTSADLAGGGGNTPFGSRAASEKDDSERVRAFGHFPGNWATFVYLIPRTDGLTSMFQKLLHELAGVPQLRTMKWSLIDEPHISLSRTVALRYHEIPHFTAHLKADIVKTSLPRFSYTLEDVAFYKNDQVNTSFLALRVGRGQEDMKSLLRTVDTCLKSFKMPPFYENPEFHVSFAWTTERVSEEEKQIILDGLQAKFDELQDQFSDDLVQHAKSVHCKSGNRTYLIPL